MVRIGISCHPTYGGSGIVATELGMELALRGHEVHFITYANPIRLDPTIPRVYYHEVEVAHYPLFQHQPYTLALASRMAEVAQRHNLDLLHAHYAIPHSVSAYLAKQILQPLRYLPHVSTLHGTDITLVGIERSYFAVTRFAIEQSDAITAISQYLKQRTLEVFRLDKPIHVIHNFVNCDLYRPDPTKPFAREWASPKENILMHISNFRPVKRAPDCIRILQLVRQRVPAHLVMIGDGPERSRAEALAAELQLTKHVTFLGKQPHIHRLLPSAHVVLIPSELEALGLVALEAMACGVPPVASRVGGLPEVVVHGETGFLEQPGDLEAHAHRVVALLTDETLYEKLSHQARLRAETLFSSERIIPQYEQIYRQLCAH